MNEQKNMMVEDQKRFVLPQMIGMDGGDDDLADDMEGLQLSFPQIKVPGGGSLVWELPSGDPQNPNYEKYLEGVILFSHNSNAYWPEGSEYDDNVPPLCQSVDGKEGYGEPGGLCLDCLQNQYGSSQKGAGKACKNMRTIYLLRSGELMPYRIPLPPTSIKPYTDFVNTAFLFRKRRIFSGAVRIGLTRETNTRLNKDYSVVNFTKLYDFEGEELAQIRSFAGGFITQIKQMNQQRAAMLAPPLNALTEPQRQFAEEHHALIYQFLLDRRLDICEYYDIAALGYLRAVQRYLTRPALSQYCFSTVAWRAMGQSLGVFFRAEKRNRESCARFSDSQGRQADLLWEKLEAELILHDLARIATKEQYALVELRLRGYSVPEAARARNVGVKRVRRLLKNLFQAYLNMK